MRGPCRANFIFREPARGDRMKRTVEPRRIIALLGLGLILTVGLSRLYAVQQDHACHVNPDKNLAEMMEEFPHGAHTVPNGLPVDRETLDWVATAGYELHV